MNKQEFEAVEKAISLAISHIIKKGCDDVFRPPTFTFSLEQKILEADAEEFRKKARSETLKFLQSANLEHQRIGPIFSSLVAKDEKSFRQVSWIDPYDAVKYLSLALLLFPQIEKARIPKSELVVHSHRRSDNEDEIFDSDFGYNSFRSMSGTLSDQYQGKWKVVTDISNFFDRIGNHSLENHLLDIGCEKKLVHLLREILFFWARDRRSYGVPVGSDASRIVSEVVLIDIDRKLRDSGIVFLRYVDDFRIFAETRADAYRSIQLLTSLLADEGLALNSKKTEVLEILGPEDPRLDPNRFAGAEHEVIDEAERVEVKVPVRISGRTQISRYYKEPGKDALKKIQKLDKADLVSQFENSADYEIEDQLKLLIKFFIYADQDVSLIQLAISRRITSIFYIGDALVKEGERLSEEKRKETLQAVLDAFDWDKAPYPYQVPVLRLLASEHFRHKELSRTLLDDHKMFDNPLFYRELILLSFSNLDRARMRNLALDAYPLLPMFVKRSILHAVCNHPTLSYDEKRPLLKNMRQHADDWFIGRIKAPEDADSPDAGGQAATAK